MRKLQVLFAGWGLDFPLGTLAEGAGMLVFEFSPEARRQGFELSPFCHPLRSTSSISRPVRAARPVAGFLDDALPDGWGRLLVDRALLARELRPAEATALDRLAIVGDNAFGALRFVPADELMPSPRDMDLLDLAREVGTIQADQPSDFLAELLKVGSPQGARPKAAVWFEPRTWALSTRPFFGAEPWLVKFPGAGDSVHAPAIEHVYATLARTSGIDIPDTRWRPLKEEGSAVFAVARFDRRGSVRVPIQSFAALLDADFRTALSQDYRELIRMVRQLTGDERQVAEFFRRCAFNVVFHNRDDHLKNFAARLGEDRRWTLAPAFDLTPSDGPGGEHSVMVAGEGKAVTREHLMRVAEAGGLKRPGASAIIDQVLAVVPEFRPLAAACAIPAKEIQRLETSIRRCAERCRS